MKKWLVLLVLLVPAALMAQGSSHIVYGVVHNSGGGTITPECITFQAFIAGTPSVYLTQDSSGCGMFDSTWIVNTGNLPGAGDGDTLVVIVIDTCLWETDTISGVLDLDTVTESFGSDTLIPFTPTPTITVLYPNGGESFYWADAVNIQWNWLGTFDSVAIDYSPNGGTDWFIVTLGTLNDGSFSWIAPSTNSTQMLVRIAAIGLAGVQDESDAVFTVQEHLWTVLDIPAGSETYLVGDTVTIEWHSSSTVTAVDLTFSHDGGGSWLPVASGLSATGTYNWVVPNSPSDSCLVKVTTIDDPSVSDQNSPFFSIDTIIVPDTIPPADIADLSADTVQTTQVFLGWTAPGDDGNIGTATTYDVRYSTSSIDDSNWAAATPATGEPVPAIAGTPEGFWLTALNPGTTYYIRMKTSDEVPNTSGLSNEVVVTTATTPDTIAPDPVVLALDDVGSHSAALSWVATGDDGAVGTADHYNMRYATFAINDSSFAFATSAVGLPAPAPSGTPENYTLPGLDDTTEYWVACVVYDDADNPSGLSNVLHFTTHYAVDTIPPGEIWDPNCADVGLNSIGITWTAPGDDGYEPGIADHYEVRYSTSPLTPSNWIYAPIYPYPITPDSAGTTEYQLLMGLESATLYDILVIPYDDEGQHPTFGHLASCMTKGILNPMDDIVVDEDAADFYLPDLNDVFYSPDAMTFDATCSASGVTLAFDDLSLVRVHLAADWFGEGWIIVTADDGSVTMTDSAYITVNSVSDAPRITSAPPDSFLVEGFVLNYDVEAYDPEGDSIIYLLLSAPTGMSIDADGHIYWNPGETEGRFDITVGVTDLGCGDTNTQSFPIQVIKYTHPLFKPRNLVAHDGFWGSIPLTWDPPEALELGLPVILDYYQVFRSDEHDYGYELTADDVLFNAYNDCYVDDGASYFYKVRAIYAEPFFQGGFSNIDGAMVMEGTNIYSSYILETPTIDGDLSDPVWDNATIMRAVAPGIDAYFANSGDYLYVALAISGDAALGSTFELFFDDDYNRLWPFCDVDSSTEGCYRTVNITDTPNDFFIPYAYDSFLYVGAPREVTDFGTAWHNDGFTTMEMAIHIRYPSNMTVAPGDSMGIAFELVSSGDDVLLQWPVGVDTNNPTLYGTLILGAPGYGAPSLIPSPLEVFATVETGWSTTADLTINNMGDGVALVDVDETSPWLSVTPTHNLIVGGLSQDYTLTLNAAELDTGEYTTDIVFHSNDPANPDMPVTVHLSVTPRVAAHYFEIYPPTTTYGMPSEFVDIPIYGGATYDNDITELTFSVKSDPSLIVPLECSTSLTGWSLETTIEGDSLVDVHLTGTTALSDSAELVSIHYGVQSDAMAGRASLISPIDAEVNGGEADYPMPQTIDGLFVVGDELHYYWFTPLTFVGDDWVVYDSLYFGILPIATNYFDRGIDQQDLPAPPGTPNSFFLSKDDVQLRRDIRHLGDSLIIWTIVAQYADGWLHWDPSLIWGPVYINDYLDMRTDSMFYMADGDTVYLYYYHPFETNWNVHLKRGWNMISVPVIPADNSLAALFPGVYGAAYHYNPALTYYDEATTLEPGYGYWVLSPVETTYTIVGAGLHSFSLPLGTRWNQIGSISEPVYFWDQSVEPDGALLPDGLFYYTYEGVGAHYERSDYLDPGIGYWCFASLPAELRVLSIYTKDKLPDGQNSDASILSLTAAGYGVKLERASYTKEFPVPPSAPNDESRIYIEGSEPLVESASPLGVWTVWSSSDDGEVGYSVTGKFPYKVTVDDGESFILTGQGTLELTTGMHKLTVAAGKPLPDKVTLLGVSPNPFNEATTISFVLPDRDDVELAIYDLGGKRVAALISEELDPGVHSVRWDAKGVSSGVYLLELKSSDITLSKRVVLVR